MVTHGYLGQERLDALVVVDSAAALLAQVGASRAPAPRRSQD
jgi:hypothetical protein